MSDTKQPVWKAIANIGDVNPIDHGGCFVFKDETGVYPPEMENLEAPDDDDGKWIIHRVILERLKIGQGGKLIDFDHDESKSYGHEAWFGKSLHRVASFAGSSVEEIRADLCSEDPLRRAQAYRDIYSYHGWVEGDQYPLELSRFEVEKRYKDLDV